MMNSHPLNKSFAKEFVETSKFTSWYKSIIQSRLDAEETLDTPKVLAGIIMIYVELGVKDAIFRGDYQSLCEHCQIGLSLKMLLTLDNSAITLCSPECQYKRFGHGIEESH
jgi:hypothetical protein